MLQRLATLLFVPGDRPDRIDKAVAAGADAVVIDLEDAVAHSAKTVARGLAIEAGAAVDDPAVAVMLRVNGVRSDHFDADIEALAPLLSRLAAVVLPMAESADDVRALATALSVVEERQGAEPGSTQVLPIVETAAGVLAAREIAAASRRVLTLLFGSADLSNELAVSPTAEGTELATARSLVVLAAAAAKVAAPLDGPYLTLDDEHGLRTSARTARLLGFGGKALIHPSQISVVKEAFAPTPQELEWAAEVDAAFTQAEQAGSGAIRLSDGTFIDYPIAYRARAMLAAHAPGGEET